MLQQVEELQQVEDNEQEGGIRLNKGREVRRFQAASVSGNQKLIGIGRALSADVLGPFG